MAKFKIEIEYESDDVNGGAKISEMRLSKCEGDVWGKVHAEYEPSFKLALAEELAAEITCARIARARIACAGGLLVTVEPGIINEDSSIESAESFAKA